jgi:hypothetical protein
MKAGLKVSYLWHDNDVLELRVIAENADFRGTAAVYVGQVISMKLPSNCQVFRRATATSEKLPSVHLAESLLEGPFI